MWKKISCEEKCKILFVFNLSEEEIKNNFGSTSIVFTQPISEHDFVSESKKIEIYKRLIEEFDLHDAVIKKHPRETTDYSLYFNNKIIDNIAPFELYELYGVRFSRAATLYSSVVNSFSYDLEVLYLGVEYDDELLAAIYLSFVSCCVDSDISRAYK